MLCNGKIRVNINQTTETLHIKRSMCKTACNTFTLLYSKYYVSILIRTTINYHYQVQLLTPLIRGKILGSDKVTVWRSGSALVSLVLINEVNLRRARLVLGWVTVSGFDSRRRHYFGM